MKNAILAISERKGVGYGFSYLGLYVALSRVREGKHIRLLLVGNSAAEQWISLHYVTRLRPPLESYALLEGFERHGGKEWENDIWDLDAAYSAYIKKTWHQR